MAGKVKVDMKWQPSSFGLANVIGQLPKEIRSWAVQGIAEIAKQARDDVQKLTPGDRLPQGWVVKTEQNPAKFSQIVTNEDPRAYKKVRLKSGGTTNLVEMLEYGTRPHEITPKNKKYLRFVDNGQVIYTKHVEHPGTRAYGMVRITTIRTLPKVAQLQNLISAMLDRKVKRGGR